MTLPSMSLGSHYHSGVATLYCGKQLVLESIDHEFEPVQSLTFM